MKWALLSINFEAQRFSLSIEALPWGSVTHLWLSDSLLAIGMLNFDLLGCRAYSDWAADHRLVPGYPAATDRLARWRPCLGFSFPIAA